MIAALIFMPLIGWGYWLIFRDVRPQVTTTVAAPDQRATPAAAVLGPENDPDQWRAARGCWTALDERQLVRLLTDSAHDTDEPQTRSTKD
ncbi:hypothetical protein BN971_00966 [Mycobacterium bohemicum DSM 44277]|uniref:Uncharacterized protein n=1 Tax=Mycobacterium bohemicum DSM 44277 TaxID=1236609 RepID=A0A0U0W368_MYCBE|nr:hypothetical protein [Mycobacterium bohemicum]MCV6972021.1 hypothetical protein [Mycobacterium bohemicum]CPR07246.1 hypothetical protein BN971_00966 [Mycobacterium bohemicum DSM 44277]